MEDKKILKITTEDGKEKEYKIICAFAETSNGKNYVLYTDDTKNNKGETEVYAAIYYPDDDTRLDDIETEEEWDIVNSVLEEIQGRGEE